MLGFVEMIKKISGNSIAYDTVRKKAQKRSENNFLDITKYTRAAIFSEVGKQTECFVRFSTVAGERGAADAERDIRGFAMKFYTEEGNWDLVGNNTPVFFLRDPLKFPDLFGSRCVCHDR